MRCLLCGLHAVVGPQLLWSTGGGAVAWLAMRPSRGPELDSAVQWGVLTSANRLDGEF